MRPSLYLALLGLAVCCCGCSNPFTQFYQDTLGGRLVTDIPDLIPYDSWPRVFTTNNEVRDEVSLLENGYTPIGYASFNAASVNASDAARQGKLVGAAVVLLYSRYRNTETGALPYTTKEPDMIATQSSQGTIQGSVNGVPSFSGRYSGTATTRIAGSYHTDWIPYSVDRYDYLATFWVKTRPQMLGVRTADLTDDLRRQIGTNRGVVIVAVVKESPAFNANMMRGDVITKVDGHVISDAQTFRPTLSPYAGQEVVFETYRDGVRREVSVRLNSRTGTETPDPESPPSPDTYR
jgi:hypothetical protein